MGESLADTELSVENLRIITDERKLHDIKRGLFVYFSNTANKIRDLKAQAGYLGRRHEPVLLRKELNRQTLEVELAESWDGVRSEGFKVSLQRKGHEPVRLPGFLRGAYDRLEINIFPDDIRIFAVDFSPYNGNRFVNKMSARMYETEDYFISEEGLEWITSLPFMLYST